MDWIYLNGTQKAKKKNSIIRELQNLNISEDNRPKVLEGFDKYTFKSTFLQQTFKQYHYTDLSLSANHQSETLGRPPTSLDSQQPISEFALLLPTQYQRISTFVVISIELGKQFIKYVSYPLKSSQMLVFSSEQIVVLSRFLSFHLNSRIISGCISVDPETGCISHQIINNSLGYLQKRIMKVPEELVSYLAIQIIQIQKTWKSVLPTIFHLLDFNESRIPNHSFWKTFKDKRSSIGQEEQNLLVQYVKQSFIQFPDMFDQTINDPVRPIRSNFLSREEKAKKYNELRSKTDVLNFNSIKFTKDINAILEVYMGSDVVKQQADLTKKQLPPEKLKEVCKLLVVQRYESRTPILSKIIINQIKREYELAKSGFSELKILHILGQKVQENVANQQYIVSKSTQQCRFINQTGILKFIGTGKSLFITRYFQNENYLQKILLEYCPQKSIDAYLTAHRRFISFQTKIFFLYQIAVGTRFLRDYGIAHNDLKPQNVLLKIVGDRIRNRSATFLTKLIDLGQSFSKYQRQLVINNRYRRGFTLPYAPPEQVRYQRYSERTDVFSIGVMIYEFVFDIFPLQVIKKKREIYTFDDHYLKLYAIAPERCKASCFPKLMMMMYQLVLRCIHPEAANRPSIDWIIIILKQILGLTEKLSSF